jgi:hypothetical protein
MRAVAAIGAVDEVNGMHSVDADEQDVFDSSTRQVVVSMNRQGAHEK